MRSAPLRGSFCCWTAICIADSCFNCSRTTEEIAADVTVVLVSLSGDANKSLNVTLGFLFLKLHLSVDSDCRQKRSILTQISFLVTITSRQQR